MQLTEDTIKFLKNFASINQNAKFEVGNTLRALSPAKDIFAVANIDDHIPKEFAIYNMNQLLSILTLGETVEVEFEEKNLLISNNFGGELKYFYTGNDIVEAPPKEEVQLNKIYSFDLDESMLSYILRVSSMISANALTFKCDGSKVSMKLHEKKNDTSNKYEKIIGDFDQEFEIYINVENLKLIPNNYTVTIGKTLSGKASIAHFKSIDGRLQYWIVCGA